MQNLGRSLYNNFITYLYIHGYIAHILLIYGYGAACHNGVNATDFGSKAPLTLGSSNEIMESFCRSYNAIVHLEHHIVQKREDSSSSLPFGPGKYS